MYSNQYTQIIVTYITPQKKNICVSLKIEYYELINKAYIGTTVILIGILNAG